MQMQIPDIKFENLPVLQAIEYIQKLDRERAVTAGTNTTVVVNLNRPEFGHTTRGRRGNTTDVSAMDTKAACGSLTEPRHQHKSTRVDERARANYG